MTDEKTINIAIYVIEGQNEQAREDMVVLSNLSGIRSLLMSYSRTPNASINTMDDEFCSLDDDYFGSNEAPRRDLDGIDGYY